MNNRLVKGISSCVLATMLLSTGAAAQTATQNNVAVSTENISFSGCVDKIRSVYTERYPEQVEVVNGVIDEVTSNETFLECYEYEGKTAFRILEDTLMDALTPAIEPYNYDGQVAWTSYTVPVITQMNDYYCGPAAVQMALIGNGFLSNTSENRENKKQQEIAKELSTSSSGGTYIFKITKYMQGFISSETITYKSKLFTRYTYDTIFGLFSTSLRSNKVIILNIPDTSYLGYYNGKRYSDDGHYVIIKKFDETKRKLTVVDPFHLNKVDTATNNYLNNEHEISLDDLISLAKDTNFWASVYTYTKDDNIESYVF
ncbi:MAG: C39 family peptidase [Oscillospiraceae bacterium]|nr:C39 family peptidase [Oscillospiraceae bacterium]